ncbi:hypothetical protein CcCBS67573_g10149 [Chytriomyces confervae]|uniref:Protein kinase domain-containing protein n=1 Tax=Chytriomyces confervae TaxID=246404 RepID=A0A507DFK1_9FUNG|nr:hypothetical protein CcCBS67573_g10149 [Chytriomyces confervae]
MTERYQPPRRVDDDRYNPIARGLETYSERVLKHTDSEDDPSHDPYPTNYQPDLKTKSLWELHKLNPFRIVKSGYLSGRVTAMEKAHCSLANMLSVRPKRTESEAKVVIRSTLEALVTCHSKDIVHRDVRPRNLLLFSDDLNSLKLGGFGVCSNDDVYSNCTGFQGTYGYMAPERLRAPQQHGMPVDIWATGATAYQLLYGFLPYQWYPGLERNIRFPATHVSSEGSHFASN